MNVPASEKLKSRFFVYSLGAMVFPWDFCDDFKLPVQKC